MELLGRYSNQHRLLTRLQALLALPMDEPVRLPGTRAQPRQRQRRLTSEQQTQLLVRYLAGERAHVLAEAFQVNRETVAKLLVDTGVRRPRSMTEAEVAEAIQLYAGGWSCARIGEHLGRDHSTIWLALKKPGVPLRDAHGRDRP